MQKTNNIQLPLTIIDKIAADAAKAAADLFRADACLRAENEVREAVEQVSATVAELLAAQYAHISAVAQIRQAEAAAKAASLHDVIYADLGYCERMSAASVGLHSSIGDIYVGFDFVACGNPAAIERYVGRCAECSKVVKPDYTIYYSHDAFGVFSTLEWESMDYDGLNFFDTQDDRYSDDAVIADY